MMGLGKGNSLKKTAICGIYLRFLGCTLPETNMAPKRKSSLPSINLQGGYFTKISCMVVFPEEPGGLGDQQSPFVLGELES